MTDDSADTPPEAIIARIQKLLALANDARGNENEMAAAATKAQALLAQWNLDAAEIGARATTTEIDPARGQRTKETTELSAKRDWQRQLMSVLARNNFCVHYLTTVHTRSGPSRPLRQRKRHMLIGRKVNVTVAVQTYEYLVRTMERLLPEHYDRRGRSAESWFAGCTDRLAERLAKQRRAAEEEQMARRAAAGSTAGALVLLTDYAEQERLLNLDACYGKPAGWHAQELADSRARETAAPPAEPAPQPTPEEEATARKAREKWEARWQKEWAKKLARIDQGAYSAGSRVGREISLAQQLDKPAARVT